MDHDFLIIGGGVAGITAGAALAGLGRVLLLEAEDNLAHHASSRSAALYEPRYGKPAVVELSLASGPAFRAIPGLLSDRGLMVVAGPDQAEAFRREAAGFHLDDIGVAAARAIVPILNPDTVAFAAHSKDAWDIDTDLMIQTHARALRAAGGQIVTGARVQSLARDGAGWRVGTTAGDFTARQVINAAGAWVDVVAQMAGLGALGFTPYRRSMARLPAPGGHDVSRWPMIFGAEESWYAKPDAGALIVSPAEEHAMDPHDAWADDMVLAEGLSRYEAMVTEPVTRVIANWAGLRTFAPDRVLVIGPDPRAAGLWWLAGQGGYGFQTAPAAAALLADLIAGRIPALSADLVRALAPKRFC